MIEESPTRAEWNQARIDVARLMRRHGIGPDTIEALHRINAAIASFEGQDAVQREIEEILGSTVR